MRWFTFWKSWFPPREEQDDRLPDKQQLLVEVQAALQDWKNAHRHLDYAVERDEIDYAIFALEAAEKRYEMLLRKAKAQQLHVMQVGHAKVVEG